MSDWLSIEEVLNEYKKKELIALLRKGLQPYDIAGNPIPPPHLQEIKSRLSDYKGELRLINKAIKGIANKKEKILIYRRLTDLGMHYHDLDKRIKFLKAEIKKLEKELSNDDFSSWETIKKPETPEQIESLMAHLKDSMFKIDDIKEIGKKDSRKTECSDEIKLLLKKIKPKLETLYNALKKDRLTKKDENLNEDERQNLFQKNVLKEYRKNHSKYKFIDEEYLQNPKLYILTVQKEKRDFIGRLLNKIVQNKGLGSYGAQYLYNCYLTITD
jgi:hypothetical protein